MNAEYEPEIAKGIAEATSEKLQKPWVLKSEYTPSPIPFLHFIERLKTNKRAGWVRMGIIKGESISDHMYRMSIMAMMAPASITSKLDIPKCTKMALIHDMAEALVGDITPADKIEKEEKSRREEKTMEYIRDQLLGKFAGGLSAQEVFNVWKEYEDGVTEESIFVHDIDKMELLLQMVEYERHLKCEPDLGEFAWVATKIQLPEIREWGKQVLLERIELWKDAGKTPNWPHHEEHKEPFLKWADDNGLPILY